MLDFRAAGVEASRTVALRVTHVIPVMDPATGGPPAIVGAVCAELIAKGVRAGVVCYEGWPGDGARGRVEGMLAGMPGGKAVAVASLGVLSRWEVASTWAARRRLPGLIAGSDVVHLHGAWDPLTRTAGKIARRMGIPYVVSGHGMFEPWAVSQGGSWKKSVRLGLGWGSMLDGAAGIHEHHAGPIVVAGRELKAPVWDIPNGVFPGAVPTPGETGEAWEGLVRRFPVLGRGPVVLFLSRLAVQKGADVLARAARELARTHPDATVLMAGQDYGGLDRSLLDGLSNVALTGPLFGEEKAAALAHAAVYVLPSRHEGFSVSVLEAMNAGLPCVITPACHFGRAVEANAAVAVPVEDAPALATAVGKLLDDPTRSAEMGERARDLVSHEYTWEAVTLRHLAMYTSILSTPQE